MSNNTNCYDCIHSKKNTEYNSAHIHCKLYWSYYKKQKYSHPKAGEHAIKNGWWDFPYDYDPIWMENDCNHFEEKPKTNI